jgi:hypothetical protein
MKDTAGAKSRYRCLLCCKLKIHVVGMFFHGPEDLKKKKTNNSGQTNPAS